MSQSSLSQRCCYRQDADAAQNLLEAADRFGVTPLKPYVESVIVETFLDATTAARFLLCGDSHSCAAELFKLATRCTVERQQQQGNNSSCQTKRQVPPYDQMRVADPVDGSRELLVKRTMTKTTMIMMNDELLQLRSSPVSTKRLYAKQAVEHNVVRLLPLFSKNL
jgi:hypothetical protein